MSDALSINQRLIAPRLNCAGMTAGVVPVDCPGLPDIRDIEALNRKSVPETEWVAGAFSDSLLHAKCPVEADQANCQPLLPGKHVSGISAGLLTSFARYSARDLQSALRADKRVSDFVSTAARQFRGLCDISFFSAYALDQVRQCMQLPGMIGVGELNINGEGRFSASHTEDPDKILLGRRGHGYRRLIEIAEAVQRAGGKVISLHLGNAFDPSKPNEEITALLEIASRFPKVNFVILHSGLFHGEGTKAYGLSGLERIGEYYEANPESPQNLWTDLSGFMGDLIRKDAFPDQCSFLRRQAELARAWRKFGIARVMFGTDDGYGPDGLNNPKWLRDSLYALDSNPFLSSTEKRQLRSENLKRLVGP